LFISTSLFAASVWDDAELDDAELEDAELDDEEFCPAVVLELLVVPCDVVPELVPRPVP